MQVRDNVVSIAFSCLGATSGLILIENITAKFQGRVLTVNVERVRLPNGASADLEIAHHPGGAAIVAVDDRQRVCMLYQFRHAASGWIWELPAGKIDNREPPLQTAQRELAEEGGMTAVSWQALGGVFSSPGVFTEVVHLYLATGLTPTPLAPEEHEVFRVEWRPFAEVLAMAHSGEIKDGKSLVGIFRAAPLLLNHAPIVNPE
jgi:8-oxo-dGTP pyrophosphatase MutT (NUDIX family)